MKAEAWMLRDGFGMRKRLPGSAAGVSSEGKEWAVATTTTSM